MKQKNKEYLFSNYFKEPKKCLHAIGMKYMGAVV
jgi:hypothetical protein